VAGLRHREQGVQTDLQQQGFDVRILTARGFAGRVDELRKIIRDERPDVIQTTLFHADVTGRLAAVGSTAKVISRLCNTDYDKIRLRDPRHRALRFRIAQFLDAWTARYLTDHLCAVSHAVKTAAIRDLRVAPERITVNREGRDPVRLSQPNAQPKTVARAGLGLVKDQKVLINVGRRDFQKGQSYLLEAVAKLVAKHPRLVLLVAGRSGDVSDDLDRLCDRLGLKDHVHFLGHREDVPDLLAAADVFVLPSFYEGLPGAVVEAMALGLPIVASDIEPVREIVQEDRNAILVRPASAGELASAIERILEDQSMAQAFGRRRPDTRGSFRRPIGPDLLPADFRSRHATLCEILFCSTARAPDEVDEAPEISRFARDGLARMEGPAAGVLVQRVKSLNRTHETELVCGCHRAT
jgi:glycosyltransferase involved in cell wall biosynthesis